MADNKKKARRRRSRADRVERALRGRLLVEEIQDHAGQAEAAVKKAGRSARNVEAYIKLQKRKAADRARIATSQPHEVSYWSKKFKVTPARLNAAVAVVGHSSKAVDPISPGARLRRRAPARIPRKTTKKRAKKKAA